MDRDAALRIDGMLMAARGELNGVAHYMKNNLSDEEYSNFIYSIGQSMAALIDISTSLHQKFPDILPKELRPDDWAARRAPSYASAPGKIAAGNETARATPDEPRTGKGMEEIELHDAILKDIRIDIVASSVYIDIDYYINSNKKHRAPATIALGGVSNFSCTLDVRSIKNNAWAGNINYWVRGSRDSPFYFYFVDGCVSVHADTVEIVPAQSC
jgi:hypothetical protein